MEKRKLRFLLSFDEASAMLKKFGQNAEEIYSESYYYDTVDNANSQQGIVCSIKRCNNKTLGNIRFRDVYGNERYVVYPFEIEDIPEQTTVFGELMYRQGCMITHRNVIYDRDGITVSVDENAYLGVQDYELMIELSEHKARNCDMITYKLAYDLIRNGVIKSAAELLGQTESPQNKSTRFFERLKINNETVGDDIWGRYWLMI